MKKFGIILMCLIIVVIKASTVQAENSREWPIWNTVKIGGQPGKALLAEISKKGYHTGNSTEEILSSIPSVGSAEDVDLVLVTTKSLQLPDRSDDSQICRAAQGQGLKLCPAEVGPQLMLQHLLKQGESVVIGMEPVSTKSGLESLFLVRNQDENDKVWYWIRSWRSIAFSSPRLVYEENLSWVFIKPRKQ